MPEKTPTAMRQRGLKLFSALGLALFLPLFLLWVSHMTSGQAETSTSLPSRSSLDSPGINQPTESQAQPKSIFDPPVHSLDEVDSPWLVVNKHRRPDPLRYEPTNLRLPNLANPRAQNPYQQILRQDAASAVEQISVAMTNAGKGTLVLISGYRSWSEQEALYQRSFENHGFDVAEQLVARAGFSEHQTGLAADVSAMGQGCEISVCFGKTEAGIWLIRNAHRFGLIVRYPEDKETITGYQYEPWHLRFVGLELASEMKERGTQTLEEFWKLEAATDYLD